MATVATLYGETPTVSGMTAPIRTVMPLPKNHGLDFSNSNESPFTIRTADSGGTDLPTSCLPIMWSPEGEVCKVLLTAMASHAQANAALTVTDTASPEGDADFTLPDSSIVSALTDGMAFKVTTPDGVYQTEVKFNSLIQASVSNKTTIILRFNQQLKSTTNSEVFENLGVLTGYVTLYDDLDLIDLDLLWHTGTWEEPKGLCNFSKVEMVIPSGLRVASKIGGTYWGEGTGTVELIGAPTPGDGEIAQHAMFGQQGKVFNLTVFKDVSSDFPAWKDEWLQNNGWFTTCGTGYTDNPTYYHGHNPLTPATLYGTVMPELGSTGAAAADTLMTTGFLTPFKAGNETDFWDTDLNDDEFSFVHPLGAPDINTTAGSGIYFNPFQWVPLSMRVEGPDFLQNATAGLFDRYTAFMEYNLRPFDIDAWRDAEEDPDKDLKFSLGGARWAFHGAYAQGVNPSWKTSIKDSTEGRWRFAPSNSTEPTLATDFSTLKNYTTVDPNHLTRQFGSTVAMVEHYWHPFYLLLWEYMVSACLMDNPDPLNDTTNHGIGNGIEAGRGLGWQMVCIGGFYAYSNPGFRQSGIPKTCLRWGEEVKKLILRHQMPYGGVCAWGKRGSDDYRSGNKEYELAYRDKMGPVLTAALSGSTDGLAGDVDGTWANYDYQGDAEFADLYKQFSFDKNKDLLRQYELQARVCRVVQSYQEAIVNAGIWTLMMTMGFSILDEWIANTVGLLFVHRVADGDDTPGTDDTEPWYLVGVHQERKPADSITFGSDMVNVTGSTPDFYWSGWSGSQYEGTSNEKTGYYYRFSLGLAAQYTLGNPAFKGLVLTTAGLFDSDYETTADDDLDLLYNGETLLAVLQQTA